MPGVATIGQPYLSDGSSACRSTFNAIQVVAEKPVNIWNRLDVASVDALSCFGVIKLHSHNGSCSVDVYDRSDTAWFFRTALCAQGRQSETSAGFKINEGHLLFPAGFELAIYLSGRLSKTRGVRFYLKPGNVR